MLLIRVPVELVSAPAAILARRRKSWQGGGMEEPLASRFSRHRFTVEVECADAALEGAAGKVLADEIISNLPSLQGIGEVRVRERLPESSEP